MYHGLCLDDMSTLIRGYWSKYLQQFGSTWNKGWSVYQRQEYRITSPSCSVPCKAPSSLHSSCPFEPLNNHFFFFKNSHFCEKSQVSSTTELKLFEVFILFGHLVWKADSFPFADAGKDWGQEEKGVIEDEMVGWHHRRDGHAFEHAPGDGEGHRSLTGYSSWGRRESDMT